MNNSKKNIFLTLCFILFVAIFFRFNKLATIPPSLNWDEAAFGYNAYSILKTGKDEFGKSFPLYFRSLDDYKLPVNTYLTVGSIAVFGYTDFSVRFPSAFFGVLTVLCVYFLVKELSGGKQGIALISSFLLAILPWHIQFSRMAAEANIGLFFLVLGVTLFMIGLKRWHWFFAVSPLALGFSAYSYLSFQIIAPMLGITLVLIYWKNLMHLNKKYTISFCMCVAIVGMSLVYNTVVNNVHIRAKGTSVFNTQQALDIFEHKEKEMFYDAKLKINLPRRIFHDNQMFTSADILTRGYLTHFSPIFLFFDYDQKQHHTPFVGLCYLYMLPFILIGFYYLIQKFRRPEAIFILMWLVIAPIPASVTWDIPHAIRVYGMVIPIVILTSTGIWHCYHALIRNNIMQTLFAVGLCVIVFISSYYYFHQYTIHLPAERSKDWVYGRKEMTKYLEENKGKYDHIIVSSGLEWPYIFMLYYSKYDPQKYLDQGGTVSGGWGEEGNRYDIFEFHKFRPEDKNVPKTLFVGKPEEFMEHIIPLYQINYLDGKPAIYIVEGDVKT